MFEPGNQLARKQRYVTDAIKRAVKQDDGARLRQMVEVQLDNAAAGDLASATWIRDSLDGKPAQQVTLSGDDDAPLVVRTIQMVIVKSSEINELAQPSKEFQILGEKEGELPPLPTLPRSVILESTPVVNEAPPTYSTNSIIEDSSSPTSVADELFQSAENIASIMDSVPSFTAKNGT